MADEAPPAAEAVAAPAIRDESGDLSAAFIGAVAGAVTGADAPALKALTEGLHTAELADLIEALDADQRPALIRLLGEDFDYTALTDLDETVRVQILEELPAAEVAEGVRELDSDDAVYILEDLDKEEQEEILARLPAPERVALQRSLDYPEESAGRRMQTDFVAAPPFWTVGQTIDYLRTAAELPDDFYEIFVVDPGYRLVGTLALDKLLRSKRPVRIADIMDGEVQRVRATDDQEAVARVFERYDLVSAPVVDDAERLVGVITADDIVDVIQEEAEEDIRRLGGVGDEEVSDTPVYIARTRIPWLVVNMLTAFLAAGVIRLFDGTIEQMVALAVLMPIVASMGGNAGTQAMTVTVRALATRDVGRRNSLRAVFRESAVGIINGVALALLVGAGTAAWFMDPPLGLVIGTALIINMLVAGLAGATIPILLNRLKVDPAVASAVFVTMMTDIVGFSAFLGLATWWFGLGGR